MQTYESLLGQNPFLLARQGSGFSQTELAEEVNVSVQYIHRHEHGLIATPAYRIAAALSDDPYQLIDDYYSWVADIRRWVRDRASYKVTMDMALIEHYTGKQHPFKLFMQLVNDACRNDIERPVDIKSQQLFNRLLCLHPRTVQQYLTSASGAINGVLREALEDAGLDENIPWLEQMVRNYNGLA